MEISKAKTNRVIVTVLGKDQLGIIAWVSGRLAEQKVNILDISQTILQEFFTMIMVVDLSTSTLEVAELAATLNKEGQLRGLQVSVQHEDVFTFMHRI
ncbi:MAG: ACT domain-containing protein [Desulfitobacteriaceae bacterium]